MHYQLLATPRTLVMIVGMLVMLPLPKLHAATQQPGSVEESRPYSYIPMKELEGRFTIAGSNTMFPLITRLVADFKRYYPNVQIGVEGQGSKSVSTEEDASRGPFWKMVQNKAVYRRGDGSDDGHHVSMQVHVLASSRKLSSQEVATFQSRYGYAPMEIPIALEAVAVYVHGDNPISGLTLDQVDAIFSESRPQGLGLEISSWGQLGLQEGWQNAAIHLYGRDQRSGTRAFFKEHVLHNGQFRSTVNEVPGSATLILEVSRDPLGIGYSGIGYQSSSVRPVPLSPNRGRPFVRPSAESAGDGSYPLTRALYLYINKQPSHTLNPALLEFLKFANSQEGQAAVVRTGVYPLPDADIESNLSKLMPSRVTASK